MGYSGEASATVRVVPDPTFDCTDVLGKVFDDENRNGMQETGERGLAGVRLVTARGLVATTDSHGRFHITCAIVPREDRGSNFVLKLDDRTLPTGYRMTTRQVQVQRATRGKALPFHFGAAIMRVVGIDLADAGVRAEHHRDARAVEAAHRAADRGAREGRGDPAPVLRRRRRGCGAGPGAARRGEEADRGRVGGAEPRTAHDRDRGVLAPRRAARGRRDEREPDRFAAPVGRRGPPSLPSVDAGPPLVESTPGSSVERQMPGDTPFTTWSQDPAALHNQIGDKIEKQEVTTEQAKIVKLKNVVPAIHFESGVADIPPSTIAKLRSVLDSMRDLPNVRLHLVGHADTQPLSPALEGVFGDNQGLSHERAGEVAEFIATALALPPEAISFDWAGDTQPIASNATEAGRAQNRRVEVEVWYDQMEAKTGLEDVVVHEEIKRVKICRTETVCKLTYQEGQAKRARVKNLIPPLHAGEENVQVPQEFVAADPAGAARPARQAARDGQVHRLHR